MKGHPSVRSSDSSERSLTSFCLCVGLVTKQLLFNRDMSSLEPKVIFFSGVCNLWHFATFY